MSFNRNIAPEILPIQQVDLLDVQVDELQNGISFYELKGGKQPVVHLQLVFPAGRWNEKKAMQSFFTASQMLEGTTNKSSQEVSEMIDLHGATIDISASYDIATVELICLSKHLSPMVQLLEEMITSPSFDESELEVKQQIVKQKFQVNLQKTDFVAQRTFLQKAFGQSHPYGYTSSLELFDSIAVSDIKAYHESNFLGTKPIAIFSGDFTNEDLKVVKTMVSQLKTGENDTKVEWQMNVEYGESYIPFEEAKQTSIRIGKPMIDIHEDEYGMLTIANAILGGYFGSRLMSNLREEKGLTYGAYSHLGSFVDQGYWFIGTDVGKENRELAVGEIKKEIQRMQEELVSEGELELVRNYVMGKYLGKVDGPFSQAKVYKNLFIQSQNKVDFQNRVNQILDTSAEDVRDIANKYWKLDEMIEVLVG